ncbi:hypothetical protein [Actinoplanes sp. NPDC026623]|uniref:hypothetical protein n=1 Tax=Actinoplanes sp. NPDC026623 TaxID=3155610 RepID=UPI00340D28F6
MEIAGLVPAAGAGRRYGMPKALGAYRGGRLVRRAAGVPADAGIARGPVVAGAPELTYADNPDGAGLDVPQGAIGRA